MNKPILIIDDDEFLSETLVLTLESGGISPVITSNSFNNAWPHIEQGVNLVLLDITMPETDGIQALHQILESYPRLPVLMLSGINHAETAALCMKQGARDYLVKPADKEKLITTIREHLPLPALQVVSPDGLLRWTEQIHEKLLKADDPLCRKLADVLIKKELFRNPELSIQAVARELKSNQKTVSCMVNERCGMNFRTLLNRVRLAAFLQARKQQVPLSMEGHSQNVGFRRYATFCEACHSVLGVLPGRLSG
ncbi:MAG: response regulator [Bacillota bacterium]|nr:response regulator [Bacillota bacterium]